MALERGGGTDYRNGSRVKSFTACNRKYTAEAVQVKSRHEIRAKAFPRQISQEVQMPVFGGTPEKDVELDKALEETKKFYNPDADALLDSLIDLETYILSSDVKAGRVRDDPEAWRVFQNYQQELMVKGTRVGIRPSVLIDARIESVERRFRNLMLTLHHLRFNTLAERAASHGADYESKRSTVKELNASLRAGGFAISHPDTNEACMLVAVASEDGEGRFMLHSRDTGKRSKACKILSDMLPFKLRLDIPRRVSTGRPAKKRSREEEHDAEDSE